jgi:hypothetical protein
MGKTGIIMPGTRKRHLLPFLFNIVTEFLAKIVRQEKEIKGIQIGKENVRLSLFVDEMILYLKDLKDSTKKLLDLVNSLGNKA